MGYSFGIRSLNDYWASAVSIVNEYLSDILNEALALECANKLWHMCDWYYEEYGCDLEFRQLSDLQGEFGSECRSLRVIRDVCNGSKHANLNKTRNPVIRKALKNKGSFSSGFSRGFDVSSLEVELVDGTRVFFDDAVEDAYKFWQGKLEIKIERVRHD